MHVLLFGNGLSLGVSDRFRLESLTASVWEGMAEAGLEGDLRELVRWANPETVGGGSEQMQGNFEMVAGAVERVSYALRPVTSLAGLSMADQFIEASEALRSLYTRIVGQVLLSVDDIVSPRTKGKLVTVAPSREQMEGFAEAIWDLHRQRGPVVAYTLNYDPLLEAALLQTRQGRSVYDGFPFEGLDNPLDRWSAALACYHLHGSVALAVRDGRAVKRRMEDVRREGILEDWAEGIVSHGLPAVILGDAKSHQASSWPFSVFYEQFAGDLGRAARIVVGGYGFKDPVLNQHLALHLSHRPREQVAVLTPTKTREEVVEVLSHALPRGYRRISATQVDVRNVTLPDAAVIRGL